MPKHKIANPLNIQLYQATKRGCWKVDMLHLLGLYYKMKIVQKEQLFQNPVYAKRQFLKRCSFYCSGVKLGICQQFPFLIFYRLVIRIEFLYPAFFLNNFLYFFSCFLGTLICAFLLIPLIALPPTDFNFVD